MARRYVRFGVIDPAGPADSPCMKQMQVTRRPRRNAGGGEPVAELPVVAVSDTTAAARVLAAIDALVD